MFALPGLLALVFVDYLRPQEYLSALGGVPLLHLLTGLAVLGFVVDLRLGLSRLRAAPHLLLTLLFLGWCMVTVVVREPGQLISRTSALLIPIAVYLLVAHAIQSFRALQVTAGLLLAICIALSALGIHQGLADTECHRLVGSGSQVGWVKDGRPCEQWIDCANEEAEPGAEYQCEKAGLLGTSSVSGRVRFRGTLEDPNELALVLALCLPFAFAFLDRHRSIARVVVLVVTAVMVGLCTLFTKSRGGQLVFLAVLGAYFVRKVGLARGLSIGLALALPILLLGGRTGGESSTMERTECWWIGLHLMVGSPLFGVGSGQFMEYHHLTAHNSYILAAAELGLPGLFLWSSILYVAIKIPIQALRARLAPAAQSWAVALLASMAGLLVGIMFLSFIYKVVFWIWVGLTGVLEQAIRRHAPGFTVRFGARDVALVVLIDGALLAALIGYTGLELGW